jgi:hypothetical protein
MKKLNALVLALALSSSGAPVIAQVGGVDAARFDELTTKLNLHVSLKMRPAFGRD